jgi:hypothetical protein
VTLGGAYATDVGGLWIDWNQDLDFDDPGEALVVGDPWTGYGPYTLTISPPEDALFGFTRMRVRLQYGGVPEPCGFTSWGEVEDYGIEVTAGCLADVNGDGYVDVLDLVAVIYAWGAGGGPADINGDGVVDAMDLVLLIGAWGSCPGP